MDKLVSVYMPTCNRLALLKRSVDSVQKQSYTNFELVIVDDASIDGTKEYLLELVKLDPRVTFISNEQRMGSQFNRNLALSQSKGFFVTGLDDDDYWKADRLYTYVNEWEDNYSFVSGGDWFVGKSHFLRNIIKSFFSFFVSYKTYSPDRLLSGNVAGNQIFTKSEYLKNIGFDESIPALQDLDAWFSVSNKYGDFKVLNKPTQYIDMNHGYERITKGANRQIALEIFSKKHNVNQEQMKFLLLENKVGLKEPLSIADKLDLFKGGFYSLLIKSIRF